MSWRAERSQYNAESDTYGESWYEHLKKFTDLGIAGYKLDPADMVFALTECPARPAAMVSAR
ncbi:MAG: hypothetical protein ACLR5G_03250 [Eubacteriales bacterium]